ncbi:unnamed protein product [Prunus brigantina]
MLTSWLGNYMSRLLSGHVGLLAYWLGNCMSRLLSGPIGLLVDQLSLRTSNASVSRWSQGDAYHIERFKVMFIRTSIAVDKLQLMQWVFLFLFEHAKVGSHMLGVLIDVAHLDAYGWNSDARRNDLFWKMGFHDDLRLWASKEADDVLRDELFHIGFFNRGESFSLDPFCKVVSGRDHHFFFGKSRWHGVLNK